MSTWVQQQASVVSMPFEGFCPGAFVNPITISRILPPFRNENSPIIEMGVTVLFLWVSLNHPSLLGTFGFGAISSYDSQSSYILRRPQNIAKSPPYFWLALHNVCFKNTVTIHSTVWLLWIVTVFLKQTLDIISHCIKWLRNI